MRQTKSGFIRQGFQPLNHVNLTHDTCDTIPYPGRGGPEQVKAGAGEAGEGV